MRSQQNISVGCQQSETVELEVAKSVTTELLADIANMGVGGGGSDGGGDDDGEESSNNGLVENFNSLTEEELE